MSLLGLFFIGVPVTIIVLYTILKVREHDEK